MNPLAKRKIWNGRPGIVLLGKKEFQKLRTIVIAFASKNFAFLANVLDANNIFIQH